MPRKTGIEKQLITVTTQALEERNYKVARKLIDDLEQYTTIGEEQKEGE